MTNDQNKPQFEPKIPEVKEPHLLDISSVQEVAQWIAPFILGLIGDVLYDMTKDAVRDMLNGIIRRFGKSRIRELETKVADLIGDVKAQSALSDDEITARVNEIFKDFR
ncbi:MAG: hypothetical protein KAV87_52955 [Desulfobacteraceae bacterium]|jgi:hypothetical protein|nr:hypothetical protein [Desulfobacteraceae bacterium]